MKTGNQITNDVVELLKGSALVGAISGGMYRDGMRPKDSEREDLMVIFTSASGRQLQDGDVTLNIYVPDIQAEPSGVWYQDSARCEELETLAQREIDTWNGRSPYRFVQRSAIYSMHDDEIHQSFVVVRLGFYVLDV